MAMASNQDAHPMRECLDIMKAHPARAMMTVAIGTAAGILGSVLIGVYLGHRLDSRPPVFLLSSEIVSNEVEEGGDLRFYVRSAGIENRNCPGSIAREFSREVPYKGKTILEKRRDIAPAPIVHNGEADYIIAVTLLPGMTPGAWNFQGETTYDCDGLPQRYRTPMIKFTVIPKKG